MASYDVLPVDNNSSGSYHSEEFSLLNEVGDGSYPNGSINHVNFDFTNMHSTLNETTPDPNAEVSLQLSKLISENLSLKEALDKNNLMMKEQLSTIPAWRELMIAKTQQQEQNLLQAKEKISSLEKENNCLQEKLNKLLGEMSLKKDIKDFCTKCETLESTLNSLFCETDFIEKDKSLLCNEFNNFYKNLEQNLIAVCHHLDVILRSKKNEKETNLLKTFTNLLKFRIAALNGSFCATIQTDEETGYEIVHQMANKEESVNDYSHTNSEMCKKLENLKESLAKKDEELNLLRNEKDELAEKLKIYHLKIQELEMASKAQFELLSGKLNYESSVAEKYKERCEVLQQQNDEYQAKLDRSKLSDSNNAHELHQEIRNLQEILKIEQRANQRDKEELSTMIANNKKLQMDYERVTQLLEVVSRDEKEKIEKLQTLNVSNEKSYIEKIDRLTAELFEVQEQLNESNADLREMKEKLSVVAEESETIPILKAQVEVYKKDFMNVEAACKSSQEEVERLTNELKKFEEASNSGSGYSETSIDRFSWGRKGKMTNVGKRWTWGSKECQEMNAKIGNSSLSSSRHNESIRSGEYNTQGLNPGQGQGNEQQVFQCPVCQNTFKNYRAAENHVQRCLEK